MALAAYSLREAATVHVSAQPRVVVPLRSGNGILLSLSRGMLQRWRSGNGAIHADDPSEPASAVRPFYKECLQSRPCNKRQLLRIKCTSVYVRPPYKECLQSQSGNKRQLQRNQLSQHLQRSRPTKNVPNHYCPTKGPPSMH